MDWITGLLAEYKNACKSLRRLYNSLDKYDPDRKTVGGMLRDIQFVIEWLETGRMPGQIKGIDLKRVYQVREWRKRKPARTYGLNVYWDSSVNDYVKYDKNPFLEVEERIDKELELKANGF